MAYIPLLVCLSVFEFPREFGNSGKTKAPKPEFDQQPQNQLYRSSIK
jgi:hypothetical protein